VRSIFRWIRSGAAGRTFARSPGASNAAQPARTRPANLVEGRFETADVALEADVVVIGSGAGGAVMASELAEAGIDVLVLEEGGYHPTESFTAEAGIALRTLYRDAGAQATIGNPPVIFSEGRCVGGSTVINGGMSWRTPEHILEGWARDEAVERISPREMAPYFERVERRISVAHQDPETIGRDHQLLREGAENLRWKVIPNLRNQLHCAGTNNCAFGCPTSAKRSTLVTYLPRAMSRGARVLADARVDRIELQGGRARGVRGHLLRPDGRRGPKLWVRAKVVVSACGAAQTPALLLRSGVRSASGQLGHNLSLHPNVKLLAIFDDDVMGWHGVHQAYQVREFTNEGIVVTAINIPPSLVTMSVPHHGAALGDLMRKYNRMVVAGCLIEDSTTGVVRNVPGIGALAFYEITEADVARAVRGIALAAELMFAAGARRVVSPFEGAPDLTSIDEARALTGTSVRRDALELFTVHLMGTARMSDAPARGVTTSYGLVHGATNLFVADASLFPTPIGVNPMETIMGIVTRNAEWLIEHRRALAI
jgi:choline dehydrogenase-like flavoprotein